MNLRRFGALGALFSAVVLLATVIPAPRISFSSVSFTERQAVAFEVEDPADQPVPEESGSDNQASDGIESDHVGTESDLVEAESDPTDTQSDQVETESDGDRLVASNEAAGEFQLIGVDFDEPPTEPVYARAQNADGTWQDWKELDANPDEGPDGEVNASTEPMWVGDATGWEISVGAQDSDAEVLLVKERDERNVVEATPVAGANPSPPLGLNSRASWGARPAKAVSYGSEVKIAVVHHSVSSNSYTASQVPAVLRGIQAYHQDGKGWSDIGYNFAVDKYGGAWEARQGGTDRPVVGAHARGFNTDSVGIVVLGDYSNVNPSAAANESVARLAGWKLLLSGHRPGEMASITSGGSSSIPAGKTVSLRRVIGHQQVGYTACPGRIQNYASSIRTRAHQWFDWLRATGSSVTTANVPKGNADKIQAAGTERLHVEGWALDPRSAATSKVRILVDRRHQFTLSAYRRRDDLPGGYPYHGTNRGFAGDITVPGGDHLICLESVAVSGGATTQIGCKKVKIPK